jgi:hypothetical protein
MLGSITLRIVVKILYGNWLNRTDKNGDVNDLKLKKNILKYSGPILSE